MSLPLLALLAAQGAREPDAATGARLNRLFAVPSLAAVRPVYLQAREAGDFEVARNETRVAVAFGKGTAVDGRAYHLDYDLEGRLLAFGFSGALEGPLNETHDAPSPEVVANASRFVRDLTGEDRELRPAYALTGEDGLVMTSLWADRRIMGRPVVGEYGVVEVTGRDGATLMNFGRVSRREEIDAETHGHDRTLPEARLREIARTRLRAAKRRLRYQFAQYVLETDRIEIALPEGRDPVNQSLYKRRIGIPIYHRTEFAPTEPGGDATIEILLDARDGRELTLGGGRGRMGTGRPLPVPTELSFEGARGTIEPLPMRSATPPGWRVDLPVGRNVFAARFEPGQGTLWISPGGREPYRAYRPDPKLRKALKDWARHDSSPTEK